MSKRQFLEKMLEDLINEDLESARGNFHQFVVESARDIHSSMIESDELDETLAIEEDVETDGADGEDSDEGKDGMMSEADGDAEDFGGAMGGDDTGGDDDGGEAVDADGSPFGGDEGGEEHEETVTVELNDLDDIKAQMAALQAKFDALVAGEEPAGEEGDMGVDAAGFPGEDTDGADEVAESGEFDFDLTEEDLLGLEEGLREVKVTMDGAEQGGGKFAGSETKTVTPIAAHTSGPLNPKKIGSEQDAHKGFEREKAPVPPIKNTAENVKKREKEEWHEDHSKNSEAEIGDGPAFATPAKTTKTPVATK